MRTGQTWNSSLGNKNGCWPKLFGNYYWLFLPDFWEIRWCFCIFQHFTSQSDSLINRPQQFLQINLEICSMQFKHKLNFLFFIFVLKAILERSPLQVSLLNCSYFESKQASCKGFLGFSYSLIFIQINKEDMKIKQNTRIKSRTDFLMPLPRPLSPSSRPRLLFLRLIYLIFYLHDEWLAVARGVFVIIRLTAMDAKSCDHLFN